MEECEWTRSVRSERGSWGCGLMQKLPAFGGERSCGPWAGRRKVRLGKNLATPPKGQAPTNLSTVLLVSLSP